MNVKNYTSTVPVNRTISRIEEVLADAGVSGIAKNYEDGKLIAVVFQIRAENGDMTVRLPANVSSVYAMLVKKIKKQHKGTLDRIREQAERTAWKLMQDWVEVQLSLVAMQQADFVQVFLPYVWDGKRTFYHALKDSGFRQLQLTNSTPTTLCNTNQGQ